MLKRRAHGEGLRRFQGQSTARVGVVLTNILGLMESAHLLSAEQEGPEDVVQAVDDKLHFFLGQDLILLPPQVYTP